MSNPGLGGTLLPVTMLRSLKVLHCVINTSVMVPGYIYIFNRSSLRSTALFLSHMTVPLAPCAPPSLGSTVVSGSSIYGLE